jgi:hypothetical protein
MKTYAEKLKDPRWQRKRLEVMQRDDFACRGCQDKANALNVHHCYYLPRAAPWDYPEKDLVTLCESCHNELTFRLTHILEMIKTPFDACLVTELLRLLGGSQGQSFGVAMEVAYAMDCATTAVTEAERQTAATIVQHAINSLCGIKHALSK